jgi:predicted DNA-binding transcriptional regulator YafY
MGFPVVTEGVEGGLSEDIGYRIPRELYELPDPGLDESELAGLRLAASAVYTGGTDGDEPVNRALRKLAGAVSGPAGTSSDPATDRPAYTGLASVPAADAAAVVFGAVSERRRVRFGYRGEERTVDPWRLSFHRGHWYLAGMDHGRGEERLFRLDRVDGEVEVVGDAGGFERPALSYAVPAPAWRLGDEEQVVVRFWVDAERAAWARSELGATAEVEERPDGSVVAEVPVTNRDAFRSFVLGYLDHAEILGPPAVRDDMVAWLERMADDGPVPSRETR